MSFEATEQLLDVFKAAALSVTKLYKTASEVQAKTRAEGYQECVEELLSYLDKENMGVSDGEGWSVRRWATERLDGRDAASLGIESEDEVDKGESISSPEMVRTAGVAQAVGTTIVRHDDTQMRDRTTPVPDPAPTDQQARAADPSPDFVVPSQDTFTFQSSHPYPQEATYPNLANLDLSDSQQTHSPSSRSVPSSTTPRHVRRNGRVKSGLGKGAGQKRKINLAEVFDISGVVGKDIFGTSAKRSRHT